MLVKICHHDYVSDDKILILDFVEFHGIDTLVGCASRNIYEEYCEYCKKNGNTPVHITHVMRTICGGYGLTTKLFNVKGRKIRVLVPKS